MRREKKEERKKTIQLIRTKHADENLSGKPLPTNKDTVVVEKMRITDEKISTRRI